jgi:hypothetical protein
VNSLDCPCVPPHKEITQMKILAITTLILGTAALTAFAAGIDGKWISEMQVGDADGKTYSHTSTFTLKNDGGVLTGTVVPVSEAPWMRESTGRYVDISDGKAAGDKFSFKVTTESKQGAKTVVYEGTIEGDQLKGIMKFRGIGLTRPFNAKREN